MSPPTLAGIRANPQYKMLPDGIVYPTHGNKPKSRLQKAPLIALLQENFGDAWNTPLLPLDCRDIDCIRQSFDYWLIHDDVVDPRTQQTKAAITDPGLLSRFVNAAGSLAMFTNYGMINTIVDAYGKTCDTLLEFVREEDGVVSSYCSAASTSDIYQLTLPRFGVPVIWKVQSNYPGGKLRAASTVATAVYMHSLGVGAQVHRWQFTRHTLSMVTETLDPLVLTQALQPSALKALTHSVRQLLKFMAVKHIVHGDNSLGNVAFLPGTRTLTLRDFDQARVEPEWTQAKVTRWNVLFLMASLRPSADSDVDAEENLHPSNRAALATSLRSVWRTTAGRPTRLTYTEAARQCARFPALTDNARRRLLLHVHPKIPMNTWLHPARFQYSVLMLAHDGIANPAKWAAWLEHVNSGGEQVRLFVVTEDTVRYDSPFLREHDTGLRARTGWCERSLVTAYQHGLKYVLHEHPTTQYVFFCSGLDLPLVNKDGLRNHHNLSCAARLPDPTNPYLASQWVHLNRDAANTIAKGPVPASQYTDFCPDEYMPLLMLAKAAVPIRDDQLTDMEYAAEHDTSPITWTAWGTPRIVVTKKNKKNKKSLTALVEEGVKKGYFFLRKVAPIKGIPTDLPSHPWLSVLK